MSETIATGRTFEDFVVGEVIRHPLGRTVTATDNAWTTLIAVNTNPIHFDAHYSAQTEFGRPLVNSPLTLAIVTGLSVADISRYAVNLGWDEVRFPKPLFHGDTVRVETEVIELRESKSRPDQGIVTFLHRAYNQNDELVASCKRSGLQRKKPQG